MSKLVALAVAVTGSTSIAVGGSYLLNQGKGEGTGSDAGGTGKLPQQSQNTTGAGDNAQGAAGTVPGGESTPVVSSTSTVSLTFENLEAFKKDWKTNSKCVKTLFEGGFSDDDKADTATQLDNAGTPGSGTFFKTEDQDSYKSCLSIDWKKDKYENNKGKGVFTWTWTFVRGDEGFVNFNIAETSSSEEGKLEFKGVFYLLGKSTNADSKWEVKYKKDSKTDIKAEEAKVDEYFPKKGSGVSTDKDDYWGFLQSSEEKLKDMCGTNNCTNKSGTDNPEKVELSWEGSKGTESGANKLKDGAKDLSWGSKIYENSSGNLENKIENFSGTWTGQTQ